MTPDYDEDVNDDAPEFCWYCTTECKTYAEQVRGVCDECFKHYNEAKSD